MDSSLVIIMEATALLSDSCLPSCWPRNFLDKKIEPHYIGYIRQTKPNLLMRVMGRPLHIDVDKSYLDLIEEAGKNTIESIGQQELKTLSNQRVHLELADFLPRELKDNELGYLNVSHVTVNSRQDQAVFFYELSGEVTLSWIVCLRRTNSRWYIDYKKRLAIS
ncbi:hypothetical protein GCM10028806_13520 [Spirosoma terrae]